MKPELEKLCKEFIANRNTVKEAFKRDNAAVHSLCANLFCARGQMAELERLKECSKLISERTGIFSKFRGLFQTVLSCILALGESPEEQMLLATEYYSLLKKSFRDTEYLTLIAFLLTESGEKNLVAEKITRGKELYRRMNKEHPYLTDDTDSVFAVTLAFSGKEDDDLIEELEACYKSLKSHFSHSGAAQTAAQILAIADGAPEEKAQRVVDLYNAVQEAGIKYGGSSELAPLAALSLTDVPLQTLAGEIKEVDGFLKADGSRDEKEEQRAVYAVMIVSNQYAGTSQVNASAMTTTLDMLIAKRTSVYISLATQAIQLAAQFLAASLSEKKSGDETSEAK